MPRDNSTGRPGPQGWWINPRESVFRTLLAERRHWEQLENKVPARVTRNPAKDSDPLVLKNIREAQIRFGIEDGYDLMFIFYVIFGEMPEWLAQLIGSCVASGGMRASTVRTLWEIVVLGQMEETLGDKWTGRDNINHFAPYNYRAGRKIGGLNGGDGSFCGAHIEGMMQYGFLNCDAKNLDSDTFPEPQSTRLYREWGNSNRLLSQFAPQGRQFDLLESERVTNVDQLKTLLSEHYKPMMVCSNWAFRPDYQHREWKDINGNPMWIYKRDRGNSWAHNMSKMGCFKAFNRWWVRITNSWGNNAHRNGDYFIIPLDLEEDWLPNAEVRTIGDLALRDSTLPILW